MASYSWVDDLDGDAAAAALVSCREALWEVEGRQLALAAHWADLHDPAFGDAVLAEVPGAACGRKIAEGCPELDTYAAAELGILLGRTAAAGEQLVRDALLLRHRHRRLWVAVLAGQARVWVAAKVARRCAAVDLTFDQVDLLDQRTTPYAGSLGPKRFLDLVEATIIELDTAAAEERARDAAETRYVRLGPSDEQGLSTLVARAHTGDLIALDAVLDRIAVILGDQGDETSAGVTGGHQIRRATALRVLANPARALALLTDAHLKAHPGTQAGTQPGTQAGTQPDTLGESALFGIAEGAWMREAGGGPLPQGAVAPSMISAPPPCRCGDGAEFTGPSYQDPILLRRVLTALSEKTRLAYDPVMTLHIHLAHHTLTTAIAGQPTTTPARVEDLGPIVAAQVRDWLAHPTAPETIATRIRVQPVLDPVTIRPSDRYEFPAPMAEAIRQRHPHDVFPYATNSSRRADLDHRIPYGRGGPTSIGNAQPLNRRHHRLKTHGGWTSTALTGNRIAWRTPHGYHLTTGPQGTIHHGLSRPR